jgi:VWFA-related protein
MRRNLLLFLTLGLGAATLAAEQQPAPQQPQPAAGQQPSVTFRAETNFVEVHAIVTDEKGAFVRDLKPEDFEVLEDGRPQAPVVFSMVDLPIEPPFIPVNAGAPIEPDVKATTRSFDGRIYVFVMDDLHTTFPRTQNVKNIAKQFIDKYLGTNDLAAVVFTSGRQESGQELTNNRQLLKAAIDRFQGQKLPSAGAERLAIHLREESMATDPDTGNEQVGRSVEGLQRANSVKDPYDDMRALNVRRSFDAVENVSKWLTDVQGRRKALLLFSEGFDYDIYQPFFINRNSDLVITEAREAVAAAQRANVNVYGIDPRGMTSFGDMVEISGRSDYPQLEYGNFRGALRELLLSQESLISLSQETGGIPIVNANDLAGGLGRIVLDNSRYYLLGYYSDSSRWQRNKFMRIQVRVKRPGLTVRARNGYLPPDTRAIEQTRANDLKNGTTPALRAALDKPVPVGDLPFRAFAGALRATDGKSSQVLVSVELDGPALKYREANGRFTQSIEMSVVAADERARVQGGDRQTFNLNLMPDTKANVDKGGVRMVSQVTLPPGRYQLRIGAHEATGGAVGTLPYDIEVPDYSKTPFAMSGLFITSNFAGNYATGSKENEWNGLLPEPPVANRVFSPAETLTWFAEVYDNSSDQPHGINITSTIQDARDGRTLVEARDTRVVQRRGQGHGVTTNYPLRDLRPGMYVLRVQATSTLGNQTAQREVLFEVK